VAAPATAQQKDLTIADIFDPETRADFGNPVTGLSWIDDGHYHWPRTDRRTRLTDHLRVEALTGATEPLFDAAALESALRQVNGVTEEAARRLAHQSAYVMNGRRTALLVSADDDLFLYEFGPRTLRRLTRTAGAEEEPSFSPDGTRVAFVRANNLFALDVGRGEERALTRDGSEDVYNGRLDWVYQEEIYGRGNFKGYWWSPDSRHLALLRLNETKVPRYPIVDDLPETPRLETARYPKAGEPNPEARLGIVDATGGTPRWVDLARYAADQPLLVDVAWSPDSRRVLLQVQDRIQSWLDLVAVDAATLRTSALFRDKTPAWVDRQDNGLRWLRDGGFLWLSERTGWRHVYRYRGDGTLVGAVTSGQWEVRTVHGVDEREGWLYFSGMERSPIGSDVYRVRLDGTGQQRLSSAEGTHTASFNASCSLYLDTWSDIVTPPQVRLHRAAEGGEVRVVDANPAPAVAEYRLARPELLHVPARDGFVMEAMLLRPPDFDPAKRYPVYQHTYGGPQAPQVKNAWGGTTYLFHQLLAQRGVVVWICDNRTASGKGAISAWPLYRNFGETELRDVEDGIAWLKGRPWVDPARIGIYGWSFGGYMVSYALTHSRSFAMGIAGGPVTDWRHYDSVYTERYMDLPSRNEEGYRRSAPRLFARDLHGQLLILHGTIDDNVHPQNTTRFAYELERAQKPFRLVLYPQSRHGVSEPALVQHLNATKLEFVTETLLGKTY
jgi:dipeptidyl-peptidase-4